MKIPFIGRIISLIAVQLGLAFCQQALAATFSISPSTISNTYSGMITLTVGGLTNGETVIVEKYFDVNTNGVIDGGDGLMQSFRLTDGLVTTIGGKTNLSVPYDSNSVASNITAQLNFYSFDNADHICGKYAFRLSSPTGRFAALTNIFTITNYNYLQSFTGLVKSGTTNITNAVVVLFDSNRGLGGAAVADNTGNYTIKAPPGTYQLVAFRSNYVTDISAPFITLGAGATITTNVNVVPATRTISGKIVDAANTNIGLSGFFSTVKATNKVQAFTWMDSNGNFTARVTASQWEVRAQSEVTLQGYVELNNGTNVDTGSGNVTNVIITLPKATAMFYGSIKDNLDNPLPGVRFYGNDNSQFGTDAISDGNGNYSAGVTAGNWQVSVDNKNPSLTNYVVSNGLGHTNINNGQALLQNFVAKLATNTISGYVKNNSNVPIVGVDVYAYDETGYQAQNANTDSNGFYSLKVANGTWHVNVNCGSGNLTSMGYQCVNEQIVSISNNNGTTSFTVYPCGPLQVATTNLPNGALNQFYSANVQANGCNQPFNWSIFSGSLPSGLGMNPSGFISGSPTTSGTFNFTVRVTDNTSATADQSLSLTIYAQLQVTTTSLPNGTNGIAYNAQLQATGGQQPYHWLLANGSPQLPPSLNINDNGSITGTPSTNGTFQFTAEVVDNAFQNAAYSNLSITISSSGGSTNGGGTNGSGQWTYKPFMATARVAPAAVVVNGLLYAVGGFNTGAEALEVYNPALGSWKSLAPMSMPRGRLAAGVINGRIYAAGGTGLGTTLEVYDPPSNTWSNGIPMSVSRLGCFAGVISNKLYVVGGTTDSSSTLEVFDPAANTWTIKAPMPTPRYLLAGGVISNKLYAIGGVNAVTGGSGLATLEVYDPATDSWAVRASMPTARADLAATVISNKLYVVGGFSIPQLEIYDPVSNSWSSAASMPTGRGDLAAAAVGPQLFAIGGTSAPGGINLPFVEQYAAPVDDKLVITILNSDATVSAAGLAAGAPSLATRNRLDAGDTSGLTFSSAGLGASGSSISLPFGTQPGTQIINIPPGDGQNGFFKKTFILPQGYAGAQLSLVANVDFYGRAFINGTAVTPGVTQIGRIDQASSAMFAIKDPTLFHAGTNELLIADANSDGGASAAAFYAFVTFRPIPVLGQAARPSAGQFQFSINGTSNETYMIQFSTNLLFWTTLFSTNAPSGAVNFVDPGATDSRRYYRTLVLP